VEHGQLGEGRRGVPRVGLTEPASEGTRADLRDRREQTLSLLEEALAAHGGRAAWESAREVTARIRSGGLALTVKRAGAPFRVYEARVTMAEPRTMISPYPGSVRVGAAPELGFRGVFEDDRVRIENEAGDTVAARADMRRRFPGLRRRLWWDPLDGLYFAGYALWNYFTTPLLLTRPELEVEEAGRRLRVRFSSEVPTHSREQVFYFDDQALLVRLDYTAEVFGRWARAKHVCRGHRKFDGLVFPTYRRVTPRGLPGPTLVWIDVENASVRRV